MKHDRSEEKLLESWKEIAGYLKRDVRAYGDGHSLFVVNVETADQKKISLPKNFAGSGVMQWSPDGKQIGLRTRETHLGFWSLQNLLGEESKVAAASR